MGTRALTVVISKDTYENKTHTSINMNMYRQMDGYPDGHGLELATLLKNIKIVDGLIVGDSIEKTANGAGCLAAQIVANFKVEAGGFYLDRRDKLEDVKEFGVDYVYIITVENLNMEIEVLSFKEKTIFKGDPEMFYDWCAKGSPEE